MDLSVGQSERPNTLAAAWRRACRDHAGSPFLIESSRRWSYAEADAAADALGAALLELGVGKAGKVGIWMPNGPEWIIALLAAARIGAVAVPLSTFYQAPELAWALRHNDIHTLLMAPRFINHDYVVRAEEAIPGLAAQPVAELRLADFPYLRSIVVYGDHDRAWARSPDELARLAQTAGAGGLDRVRSAESQVGPNDDCIIINTSGSTARPKAVVHTHESTVGASAQIATYFVLAPGEITYTGYPFFWIAGLNLTLLPTIYAGGAIAFSPTPKPEDAIRTVNTAKVTRIVLPPAQFGGFFAAAGPDDLASIRKLAGAAPEDRLRVFGTNRGQAFGMTESFGMHSIEPDGVPVPAGKEGAMGRTISGVERRIRNPQTGEDLPAGEIGELFIRGPNLFRGYYKMSRHEVFDKDGFFATGDRGMVDTDGFFWFAGRSNEMIKSAGANVAPREVELALEECDGVANAYVFSIPDDAKGEAVTAVVVRSDETVTASMLRKAMSAKVSSYKVPDHYFEIDPGNLPGGAPWKSARELVDKRKLRKLILDGKGRALPV